MIITRTRELPPVTVTRAEEITLFDGISDALRVHDLWLAFAAMNTYAAVVEVVGYKGGNEVFVEPATFSNQQNTGFRSNSFPATQNNLSIARGAIMLDGWDGSGMQSYLFPNRIAGVVDKITARIKSFTAATWGAWAGTFDINAGSASEMYIDTWKVGLTATTPPADLIAGTPFTVTSGSTLPSCFVALQTYYLCNRSGTGAATKFNVAASLADALAGNKMTLTDEGNTRPTANIPAVSGTARLWSRLKSYSHPV